MGTRSARQDNVRNIPFGRAKVQHACETGAFAGVRRRFSRPGFSYRVFQLLDLRARVRGVAVTTVREGRALVLELQVGDESSSDLPDLVGAVHEALHGTPVERLFVRSPREGVVARRLTAELGFAAEPSDTVLLVRPFDPGFDLMAAGRAFDYRFLDHDVF